jgi:hypothetical protein
MKSRNRATTIVGLLMFGLTFSIASGTKQDLARTVATVMPSVFHLEAKTSKGKAIGSGVVLREDGLALTAAHVVDKSSSLEATFSDGKRYPVTVVMKDSAKDYAILQIRGSRFKPAVAGRAKSLELGQDLFVIGSPKGLKFSVSKGIVSALRENHVQTDTAINPGNSGGPVFTSDGKLVAIVNFGLRDTEGLKFCLMIDAVDPRSISGSVSSGSGSSSSSSSSSSGSTATPDSGRWFVVATKEKKTQKLVQVSGNTSENIDWMSRYRGYYIDQVGKGDKGWMFVLSEGSDLTDQDYIVSSKFPREWVSDNWKKKLSITSVARNKGDWIVVMSKSKKIAQQAYRVSSKFDEDYVNGMAEKGFVLTDVDSDKDYVLHVVTRYGTGSVSQKVFVESSVPTRDIRSAWDDRYSVSAVGYLEKEKRWVIGMSRGNGRGSQAFWEGAYLPADWIKERWGEGYSIVSIR